MKLGSILETIMSKLKHGVVDLLKMDVERHEYDVVQHLMVFPSQIVFETHLHNAYGMFGRPVSHNSRMDFLMEKTV